MQGTHLKLHDIDCPILRGQVKELIEDLCRLCPSDAEITAQVCHVENGYRAEVCVASQGASMKAEDTSPALFETLAHLRWKLLLQILDWRNRRFAT